MTENRDIPYIAIALPTYKRHELLIRAINSIKEQTYTDWKCCIADDDTATGKEWNELVLLCQEDARFIIAKNTGPHGQVGNTNAALTMARDTGAPWIKLLHDDDELGADCLEIFAKATRLVSDIATISCGEELYVHNRLTKQSVKNGNNTAFFIEQKYVHLGMYLQDDVGGGTPSQMMLPSSLLSKGVWFKEYDGIQFGVDSMFFCDACRHGGSLVINRPLVIRHQGHETITSIVPEEALDKEYYRMREHQLQFIDPSLNPPSLETISAFLKIIRALNRFTRRRFTEGLKLTAAAGANGKAWSLAIRWGARRLFPGKFHNVPRQHMKF